MEQRQDQTLRAETVPDTWPQKPRRNIVAVVLGQRELIANLVARDIRSRYKQSLLGVAWAVLTPVAMMLVSTVVFSGIARIDTGSIPYPIFVYIAVLLWNFFNQGLVSGSECLVANFNLITKIFFPREVFPITAILGRVVDLGVGMAVMVPLFFLYHVHLTWMVFWVLPILLVQMCLTFGLAFLLSSINVFYRDIRYAVPLALQVWMYLTPIYYPLSKVPHRFMFIYMVNPMTPVMESYRRVTLEGKAPTWGPLGVALIVSVIVLAAGYRVFKKLEPAFAEIV